MIYVIESRKHNGIYVYHCVSYFQCVIKGYFVGILRISLCFLLSMCKKVILLEYYVYHCVSYFQCVIKSYFVGILRISLCFLLSMCNKKLFCWNTTYIIVFPTFNV